ncbi:hypothetical protein J3R30DRAFT_1786713 [Lentinula aciculospora]|uniref:C2H2-type domain-containing protein n=1 Tax=Lentinula aciculospora TaxID=153920 RepID=A0A9W9DRW1_9AGAR|nr:hypothetical protein J3R30DRAFT_1786713 [Lentinula aciculospora]
MHEMKCYKDCLAKDVTLPPISQIFNTIPSTSASGSDLSLPPLRVGPEGTHQSDSRSSRGYGSSSYNYSSGVPDLQDPRMKRARYGQSAPGGSSYLPPPINRGASYSTSVASPYQPSGMTMPGSPPVMHPGRMENRNTAAPSSNYGPSPYIYAPPPSDRAQSSYYAGSSSGPSRVPAVGDSRREMSRGHDHPSNAGQGTHSDDGQSKANKYECRFCGKGFLRPSALKIHIISHTGDKDFVCPEENCGRRFGVRSNMLRHIRLVHQSNHSQSSGEEPSKDDEWSE